MWTVSVLSTVSRASCELRRRGRRRACWERVRHVPQRGRSLHVHLVNTLHTVHTARYTHTHRERGPHQVSRAEVHATSITSLLTLERPTGRITNARRTAHGPRCNARDSYLLSQRGPLVSIYARGVLNKPCPSHAHPPRFARFVERLRQVFVSGTFPACALRCTCAAACGRAAHSFGSAHRCP